MRFCLEAEPHLAAALTEWADATAAEPQEERSTALLAAWGATRAFERRLMTLLEGHPAVGDGTDYDAMKHKALAYLQAGQKAPEPGTSLFDVCRRRRYRTCSKWLHAVVARWPWQQLVLRTRL
jgi:hypothetical protein